MSLNVEQFAAANKATVDSLLAVANTALASAERIAALNLNTARSALEDTASGVQTVLSAKDPQAALAAQKSLTQPAVDKAVAYGKSVFEITSQTQQELAKMGWHCVTIWECELEKDRQEATLRSLEYTLNHIYLKDHTQSYPKWEEREFDIAAEDLHT